MQLVKGENSQPFRNKSSSDRALTHEFSPTICTYYQFLIIMAMKMLVLVPLNNWAETRIVGLTA